MNETQRKLIFVCMQSVATAAIECMDDTLDDIRLEVMLLEIRYDLEQAQKQVSLSLAQRQNSDTQTASK